MNTKTITVTKEQLELLLMGLRYLEMHHPSTKYKKEFTAFLNDIISQTTQAVLFET